MRVPATLDFPELDNWRVKEDKTVLVKYLNLASGSLAGLRESKRENVCRTGIGRGTSRIAPWYIGIILTFPETLSIEEEYNEFISGVMNEEKTKV